MDTGEAALAAAGVHDKPRGFFWTLGGKAGTEGLTGQEMDAKYSAAKSAAGACASSTPPAAATPP